MAWNNGFYSITSNGDLTSFFEAIRDNFVNNVGFEITEFMPEDTYTMTLNTKIGNILLTISSTASETTKSNSINIIYKRNDITLKNTMLNFSSSSYLATDDGNRTINFHTFENSKRYKNFALSGYNSTTCTINSNFDIGTAKVISIMDNSAIDMCFCENTFYSDNNLQLYTCTNSILATHTCDGIIMIPYVLANTSGSNPKVTHYVDSLYLSSTNTTYHRYKCNNKQYIALANNTMMEE